MPRARPRRRVFYRELPPGPALFPHVACFWFIRNTAAGTCPAVRVLPDGCMDIVLDPGGLLALGGGEAAGSGPASFLTGVSRSAALVSVCGSGAVAGVRFRPGGAAAFLGLKASDLSDSSADLDAVTPGLAAGVSSRISRPEDPGDVLAALEAALSAHAPRARECDPLVRNAVRLLSGPGGLEAGAVAESLGLGLKRLERTFAREVGLGPKMLGRILRLHRAVRLLGSGRPLAFSGLALAAGCADQAHLCREFRALAGASPGQFLAELGRVDFLQYESYSIRQYEPRTQNPDAKEFGYADIV